MSITRIAINGAAGRMGRRLLALGSADKSLEIVAAIEHAGHPQLGRSAGELAGVSELAVPLTSELSVEVDAVIDFSIPESAEQITALCSSRRLPLVMATTGLSDEQKQQLAAASKSIPLVWAPNMSLAVNLAMKLCETAAAALKEHSSGVDVEIMERHHRYKEDAPSGTALRFGELIAAQMGQTRHVHGREGRTGQRPQSEIGYHALRVGDNPGEHTIVFGLLGETLEITIRATNRDAYALGALTAAKWVARQAPGMYSMFDVLDL